VIKSGCAPRLPIFVMRQAVTSEWRFAALQLRMICNNARQIVSPPACFQADLEDLKQMPTGWRSWPAAARVVVVMTQRATSASLLAVLAGSSPASMQ
jgi:hypothetical protein